MTKTAKIDSLVIDTGVLIEYLSETVYGESFDKHFLSDSNIKYYYMSPLVYTELMYIFCRKMGIIKADQLIKDKFKHILVLGEEKLRYDAVHLKCKHGIALADCYSIAAGKVQDCPVLMKKEQELKDIDLSEFRDRILFIGNFV